MAQVFVTGGSGFLGRALLRRLRDEGHAVRALVRSDAAAGTVAALGAEPVRGELTDPVGWRDAARGTEVVFHLAAETDVTADRAVQRHATVEGTRAAVHAARYAQVPRFVHAGSEAAILAGQPVVEADETVPLRPDSECDYCAAKADAEAIVIDADAPGFATVSIRPRFVWGPGSPAVDGLVAAARAGLFAWVGGSRHVTDVTHVDNAVEGLVLGWRKGRPGQAYFVTDRHRVVFRDFLEAAFVRNGVTPPTAEVAPEDVPVPARWYLGQVCTLNTDKAVRELGYVPVQNAGQGIAGP